VTIPSRRPSVITGEPRRYFPGLLAHRQIARALREAMSSGEYFSLNVPRGTSAAEVPLPANVICIRTMTRSGTAPKGERLIALALLASGARRLRSCCWRATPLLFMGEEYDAPRALPVLHAATAIRR